MDYIYMVFPLVLSSVDFFFISIAYPQELFKSLSSSSTCGRIIIPYRNPVYISNDTLDFSMELRNGISLGIYRIFGLSVDQCCMSVQETYAPLSTKRAC